MRGSRSGDGVVVRSALSCAALATLVTLGACVVTPTTPPPRGILVSGPPPALIREERSSAAPPPTPAAAWLAGCWHWTGLQYAWIPGHWEAAPPLNASWHAPAYVQNNGAYFYEPGGWSPATVRPAPSASSREAFH